MASLEFHLTSGDHTNCSFEARKLTCCCCCYCCIIGPIIFKEIRLISVSVSLEWSKIESSRSSLIENQVELVSWPDFLFNFAKSRATLNPVASCFRETGEAENIFMRKLYTWAQNENSNETIKISHFLSARSLKKLFSLFLVTWSKGVLYLSRFSRVHPNR